MRLLCFFVYAGQLLSNNNGSVLFGVGFITGFGSSSVSGSGTDVNVHSAANSSITPRMKSALIHRSTKRRNAETGFSTRRRAVDVVELRKVALRTGGTANHIVQRANRVQTRKG